jgi:hypothetical protein
MEKRKALDILKEACAGVVANLQTHSTIQQALQTVEKELFPLPEPKKEEKK